MKKYRININDKNDNPVYVGDVFDVNGITKVKVVKDLSKENIECDRDFDVEDEEGNRIWNAYIIIRHSLAIK